MNEILKHILTGKDNETHDIGKWSWLISLFAVFGHTGWNLVHGIATDVVSFATAIAAVVGAHGAVIAAKKATEPEPKE